MGCGELAFRTELEPPLEATIYRPLATVYRTIGNVLPTFTRVRLLSGCVPFLSLILICPLSSQSHPMSPPMLTLHTAQRIAYLWPTCEGQLPQSSVWKRKRDKYKRSLYTERISTISSFETLDIVGYPLFFLHSGSSLDSLN